MVKNNIYYKFHIDDLPINFQNCPLKYNIVTFNSEKLRMRNIYLNNITSYLNNMNLKITKKIQAIEKLMIMTYLFVTHYFCMPFKFSLEINLWQLFKY